MGNAFTPSTAFWMCSFILAGICFINFTPYIRHLLRGRIRGPQNSAYLIGLLILLVTWTALLAGSGRHYTNTFELTLIFAVILNLGFPALFKTPTENGRVLFSQIEGYREFLTRVEVDRLHRMHPPLKTSPTPSLSTSTTPGRIMASRLQASAASTF